MYARRREEEEEEEEEEEKEEEEEEEEEERRPCKFSRGLLQNCMHVTSKGQVLRGLTTYPKFMVCAIE
ncbi:hypothetical protein M0804_013998 [Polistes exclamans]|nr:hypothetical protein M0804_014000 [Polistes exclamans]KAI4475926.1 hypothetical protein M0804_013998 [Polistes exclamans]